MPLIETVAAVSMAATVFYTPLIAFYLFNNAAVQRNKRSLTINLFYVPYRSFYFYIGALVQICQFGLFRIVEETESSIIYGISLSNITACRRVTLPRLSHKNITVHKLESGAYRT